MPLYCTSNSDKYLNRRVNLREMLQISQMLDREVRCAQIDETQIDRGYMLAERCQS
jgi:hypothetical protein